MQAWWVAVALEDIHAYLHLHGAISGMYRALAPRSLLARLSLDAAQQGIASEVSEHAALAAWLDLGARGALVETHVWDEVFGPADARAALLQPHAELPLSESQCQAVRSLRGAVTVLECFAGGGKTTLLAAMARCIIHRHQEQRLQHAHQSAEPAPLLIFLAPTKQARDCRQGVLHYHDRTQVPGSSATITVALRTLAGRPPN